jgi:hypothetical protein
MSDILYLAVLRVVVKPGEIFYLIELQINLEDGRANGGRVRIVSNTVSLQSNRIWWR